MENVDKKINDIFKYIKETAGNSSDIVTRIIKIGQKKIGYVYLESVSSDDKISDFLVRGLSWDAKNTNINLFDHMFSTLENTIINSKLNIIETYDDVFYHLASGFTVIFVDGYQKAIAVETRIKLDRGVVEATTEAIVRGPKDSFTENHNMNIGLIRKRIKDPKLWFTEIKVGTRTKTKVAISYLSDIVDKDKIDKTKKLLFFIKKLL